MVNRALRLIGVVLLAACSANDDIPAPALSAVQPDQAVPGTTVTVFGSYLCQQPPSDGGDIDPLACEHMGTVSFDTVPGAVTSYADTMVVVEVPEIAPGSVNVVVLVAGRSSNGVGLVVE